MRAVRVSALATVAVLGLLALSWSGPAPARSLEPAALLPVVLTAPDGPRGDYFGDAVALDGDTAIIGAPDDDLGAGGLQGSAYVFTRSSTGWALQQKLVAGDGAAKDWFGDQVAVSGDTAVVTAMFDTVGTRREQGSAYVFVRVGTTWYQQQQLVASDGQARDMFGCSVALSGDTTLVGTRADQSAAYVFKRTGSTWSEQAKLVSPDGSAGADFASTLAVADDTAFVGAPHDSIDDNLWQGSVYVFGRGDTGWSLQQKLVAPDAHEVDQFGSSVALSGDTALIGACCDDIGGVEGLGSAYVFTRAGSAWRLQQKLTASDGKWENGFGGYAALSGDTALIGAAFTRLGNGVWPNGAYVFVRTGGVWSQQQKFVRRNIRLDCFVSSLALSGDTALVGDIGGRPDGAAFVYQVGRDVFAPTTRAFPAAARPQRRVRLKFRVDDPLPSCGLAIVKLKVFKDARLLRTIGARGTYDCNLLRWRTWRCTLPRGHYTIRIYATDVAGHAQSKVGSAALIVR
jgi:hypothetical protein